MCFWHTRHQVPKFRSRNDLFYFTGYGLKCYTCASAKDWETCDKDRKEITCASQFDSCAKVYLDGKVSGVSVESFAKSCGLKSACDPDKVCKAMAQALGGTVNKCEVNCCDGDLCNGAKVPMISAFILLACALVAFFRYF